MRKELLLILLIIFFSNFLLISQQNKISNTPAFTNLIFNQYVDVDNGFTVIKVDVYNTSVDTIDKVFIEQIQK